ncbi:hypothetical protein FISHEDRAFT_56011 [Fistulina hepatica ATCC 64428]|uniref:Uncharacterized protein n=1 Tax=Fistulina hepatica ATCC 64428 TaxID=1128425 RepID=A0A0D7AK81_9AGAR|nr:hypothetical protein FISHEDRAFT_56011 [Fistulina hepatica ATCC 64428]
MFSAFSAFILSGSSDKDKDKDSEKRKEVQTPPPARQEEPPTKPLPEPSPVRTKRRANETFIIVRPPPAKSNHPLNLQVQLVPPHTRAPGVVTPRQSIDSTSDERSLARTPSTTSTSTSSTASFASMSSATSSRRAIVPLYNLQAHNVMTNTVVDAGTDARVAKFQKKGLELIDVAVLEPAEVWGPPTMGRTSSQQQLLRPTTADVASTSDLIPSPALTPPSSSAVSLTSQNDATPQSGQPGRKKLFGRLFKNSRDSIVRDSARDSTFAPVPPTPTSTAKRISGHMRNTSISSTTSSTIPLPITPSSKRRSFSPLPPISSENPPPPNGQTPTYILEPTLDLMPTLLLPRSRDDDVGGSRSVPRRGKAIAYYWPVKRWLKGNEGTLANISRGLGQLGVDLPGMSSGAAQLAPHPDVRLEWRREKRAAVHLKAPSSRGSSLKRRSGDARSLRRQSLQPPSVESREEGDGNDVGAESDPEDSETPWVCVLRVRDASNAAAAPIKVRVATLSPTPHHPKVVAMQKIVYPLPRVEMGPRSRWVEEEPRVRFEDEPRLSGDDGQQAAPCAAVVLTPEELKDMICCTALWVVVREGFGGITKERRKGDGWRIRA